LLHAFDTQRLRVFKDYITPTARNAERNLFIAFRTDEDRPMVCANMLLWKVPALGTWSIDWHEVATEHRRQGIGTKFCAAIETHLGDEIRSEPATDDGEHFLNNAIQRNSENGC
jgi:hypothetical protein